MGEKILLVLELGDIKEYEQLYSLANNFIGKTFDDKQRDKIHIDIEEVDDFDDSDRHVYSVNVRVFFNEYKWVDGTGKTKTEYIGISLEERGLMPIYIDGKYVAKSVFEYTGGVYISGHDKVYGIDARELYSSFVNSMLTC